MSWISYTFLTSSAGLAILATWFYVSYRVAKEQLHVATARWSLAEDRLADAKAQLAHAKIALDGLQKRAIKQYEETAQAIETSIPTGPGATAHVAAKLRETINAARNSGHSTDPVPPATSAKPKS